MKRLKIFSIAFIHKKIILKKDNLVRSWTYKRGLINVISPWLDETYILKINSA